MPQGIITRGYASKTIITRGYAGVFRRVIEAVVNLIPHGRSSKKRREVEETTVWAKMIELNGRPPKTSVEGRIRINIDKTTRYAVPVTEHVTTRIKRFLSDIVITVSRVGGGRKRDAGRSD